MNNVMSYAWKLYRRWAHVYRLEEFDRPVFNYALIVSWKLCKCPLGGRRSGSVRWGRRFERTLQSHPKLDRWRWS